ncbi:BlaI/MecI/CopY family transcriptional regulator [Acutalibacter caecimuris]|uniref:BlaI/MecI/CopY family transcriptional regulator n=1 Tax=Acutalibacter caecimuris TaxID=3093657 RepID=UPI002AC986FD|nr:BlaI/MecI/CopY family transcriptional regulator [Acutalibacter sp. M00118]
MPCFSLSKSEEKLMQFLWEQDRPLSALEMLEALDGSQAWGEHYLRVMLKSLEKKGAIEYCGFVRRANQYARRFHCTLTQEEYYVQLAQKAGVNVDGVFRAAAVAIIPGSSEEEKEELIQKLEAIIEEYRARDDDKE